MKIEVREGNPGRGNWAVASKREGGYLVVYHKSLDGFPLAVAVFHELLHVICWEYLPFANINKEHKFVNAMEKSLRRHKKRYWEGR